METKRCDEHRSTTGSGQFHCLWLSIECFAWSMTHCFNGCPALVSAQSAPATNAGAPGRAALKRMTTQRLQAECARRAGRGINPEQAAEVMQNFNEQGLHARMQVVKTHYSLLKHHCYGLFAAVGTGIYDNALATGYVILYDYSVFALGRFKAHEVAEVDVMTNDRHLHTLQQLATQETTKCFVKEHDQLVRCGNIIEWKKLVRPYLEQ